MSGRRSDSGNVQNGFIPALTEPDWRGWCWLREAPFGSATSIRTGYVPKYR